MNDATDINALKIAQYLEDGMSPGEEMAFMEELNRDEVLRKSFEEALLLREVLAAHGGSSTAHGGVGAAPAGNQAAVAGPGAVAAHLHDTNAPPVPITPPLRVLSLFRVRAIGAACVAIILIAVGIARSPAFEPHYSDEGPAVAPAPDELSRLTALSRSTSQAAAAVQPDSLFAQFYNTYVGEKDPVEISLYYQHYRAGDYASVLAARQEDYRLMGTGRKTTTLDQYMQLYRGLSYLAENQPVRALGQFDSLLVSPHVGKEVYCSAQWYAALAALQREDIPADSALAAAARGAQAIGQTASPYRQKAARLSAALFVHRP